MSALLVIKGIGLYLIGILVLGLIIGLSYIVHILNREQKENKAYRERGEVPE